MFKKSAKDKVLNQVRKALKNKMPEPFADLESQKIAFPTPSKSLEEEFAQVFIDQGGKFIYCANHIECIENLEKLTDSQGWNSVAIYDDALIEWSKEMHTQSLQPHAAKADVILTPCESIIARSGSIVLTDSERVAYKHAVKASVHLVVAYTNQLVWTYQEGLDKLKKKYNPLPSTISLISGPSKTADIENKIVLGPHGTKELFLFLIER